MPLEFDLDSWNRKWKHSVGVLMRPDGTRFQGYYEEFEKITKTEYAAYLHEDGMYVMGSDPSTTASLHNRYAMPQYYPIESGMYWMNAQQSLWAMVCKTHKKSFTVGLCDTAYNIWSYDEQATSTLVILSSVDLLTPMKYTPFDPDKPFGVLSKKVWWKHNSLLWCSRQIGIIKKRTIYLDDNFYIPFIQPLVGHECNLQVL